MVKKGSRRLRKNQKMVYAVIIVAIVGLVATSVLGYLGTRMFPGQAASPPDIDPQEKISQIEQSIASIEETLQTKPEDLHLITALAAAYAELGGVYIDNGETELAQKSYEEAVKQYGHSLELNPANVDVRTNRAVAAFQAGNNTLAQEEFEAAIEQQPTNAAAQFNYGVFLFYGLDQPEDAIKRFEQVVALGQTEENATLYMYAQTLIQMAQERIDEKTGGENSEVNEEDTEKEGSNSTP